MGGRLGAWEGGGGEDASGHLLPGQGRGQLHRIHQPARGGQMTEQLASAPVLPLQCNAHAAPHTDSLPTTHQGSGTSIPRVSVLCGGSPVKVAAAASGGPAVRACWRVGWSKCYLAWQQRQWQWQWHSNTDSIPPSNPTPAPHCSPASPPVHSPTHPSIHHSTSHPTTHPCTPARPTCPQPRQRVAVKGLERHVREVAGGVEQGLHLRPQRLPQEQQHLD